MELLVAGDEPAATRAAPALARLAEAGRAAVAARLAHIGEGAVPRQAPVDEGARPTPPGIDAGVPPRRARVDEGARTGAARKGTAAGQSLAHIDEGARARLVAVVGLLARAGDDAARALLIAHATDAAPRVRRAAAV
ncbi:MAG TPA: hypothetical protein VGD80_16070, partial [Kofleriaceae bacterium]